MWKMLGGFQKKRRFRQSFGIKAPGNKSRFRAVTQPTGRIENENVHVLILRQGIVLKKKKKTPLGKIFMSTIRVYFGWTVMFKMYKTNAKRKSHITKNHPNCELPKNPTDKVRNYERNRDMDSVHCCRYILGLQFFFFFFLRPLLLTTFPPVKSTTAPRLRSIAASGVTNNTFWNINWWNTNGSTTTISCHRFFRNRNLRRNLDSKRKKRINRRRTSWNRSHKLSIITGLRVFIVAIIQ